MRLHPSCRLKLSARLKASITPMDLDMLRRTFVAALQADIDDPEVWSIYCQTLGHRLSSAPPVLCNYAPLLTNLFILS